MRRLGTRELLDSTPELAPFDDRKENKTTVSLFNEPKNTVHHAHRNLKTEPTEKSDCEPLDCRHFVTALSENRL